MTFGLPFFQQRGGFAFSSLEDAKSDRLLGMVARPNRLARTRHTNTLVIADRGFPFWPMSA